MTRVAAAETQDEAEAEGPEGPEGGTVFVQTLARGLDVIRAFDADHPTMTLSDVARLTGLSRSVVRRLLHTLRELGYVWSDGKVFALRPRILDLGYSYLSGLSLPEVAQPHLQVLSDEVHESTSVSVLVDADVAYVARVPTRRIMSVAINIGTRFPAYATSMGRVLLASLGDAELAAVLDARPLTALTPHTRTARADLEREIRAVRERGWSLLDQELEVGLRSLAVPLRSASGEVVAAINVAASAIGDPADFVAAKLEPLRRTAALIDYDLAQLRHHGVHPLGLPAGAPRSPQE